MKKAKRVKCYEFAYELILYWGRRENGSKFEKGEFISYYKFQTDAERTEENKA